MKERKATTNYVLRLSSGEEVTTPLTSCAQKPALGATKTQPFVCYFSILPPLHSLSILCLQMLIVLYTAQDLIDGITAGLPNEGDILTGKYVAELHPSLARIVMLGLQRLHGDSCRGACLLAPCLTPGEPDSSRRWHLCIQLEHKSESEAEPWSWEWPS